MQEIYCSKHFGGGGRTGTIELSGHGNLNTEGLSAEQVAFLETVINESELLQEMMWSIINSGVNVDLSTIVGDYSEVGDNGNDRITFQVAKGLFNLDISIMGFMATALQHLGHELAHVTGRITGERIAYDQMHPSGIRAEELRAQQIGNLAMVTYTSKQMSLDAGYPVIYGMPPFARFFNSWEVFNYRDRTTIYNINGMFFPGTVDFSTFKKASIIKPKRK